MKAVRLYNDGGYHKQLVYEDVSQPHPGDKEVLVRAYASVIPAELTWLGTVKLLLMIIPNLYDLDFFISFE